MASMSGVVTALSIYGSGHIYAVTSLHIYESEPTLIYICSDVTAYI